MKTPRELLLDQHRSVEPKLDALRQDVVASLEAQRDADRRVGVTGREWNAQTRRPAFPGLRDLARSLRWHLAGMGAAWVVVAVLSIDPSPTPAFIAQRPSTLSPRQFLAALLENRRQLSEMIQSPAAEPAPVPHATVPARRGELQSATALA